MVSSLLKYSAKAVSVGMLLVATGAHAAKTPITPVTPAKSAATSTTTSTTTPATKKIVAQVADQKISLAEFEDAFRWRVARLLGNQGIAFKPEMLKDFAKLKKSYLPQYVHEQAVYNLARKNAKLDDADVQTELKKLKEKFDNDSQFAEALTKNGFQDEAEYIKVLKRQLYINAYLNKIKERLKPSMREYVLRNYYNLNRQQFKQSAKACVRHILLKTEKEAQEISKKLSAGTDFAKLAKQSIDPSSARNGGDLGCIPPEQTVPPFDKASFSGPLKKPQVVKTQYGWHVLIVDKRTPEGVLTFEKATPHIREQLSQEAAHKYLERQVKRLKVVTFPEVLGTVEAPSKSDKADKAGKSDKANKTNKADKANKDQKDGKDSKNSKDSKDK